MSEHRICEERSILNHRQTQVIRAAVFTSFNQYHCKGFVRLSSVICGDQVYMGWGLFRKTGNEVFAVALV